jgi:hypothetical protein
LTPFSTLPQETGDWHLTKLNEDGMLLSEV